MLPAGSSWMNVLELGGVLLFLALLRWLLRLPVRSRIGGSLAFFSIVAECCIRRWTAEVSCPIATLLVWPACWIDTPERSSSSSSRAVQYVWDIHREE